MTRKITALILGLTSSENLSYEEKEIFSELCPLGFILFSRNCKYPQQVKNLIAQLKDCVSGYTPYILIDQEGGKVKRLPSSFCYDAPAAKLFGDLYRIDKQKTCRALWLNIRLIAEDLYDLGINVNCLPVLDVYQLSGDDVIGNRAFSDDARIVCELGKIASEALLSGGIQPVIKHLPGHGRANCDSHYALPSIDVSCAELKKSDFVPFMEASDINWGMSAHISYPQIDDGIPASFSSVIIEKIIRGVIDFQGFLISDDICMGSLYGSMKERAVLSLSAGCDAVLHCSGRLSELEELLSLRPLLSSLSMKRLHRFSIVRKSGFNRALAMEEISSIIGKNISE